MNLPTDIDYSTVDPEKIQKIIDFLTKLLAIGEQQQLKTRQLRWALTKQMRLNQSKFWLEDKTSSQVSTLFIEYCAEYRQVFGKSSPFICHNVSEDAKCWAMWEEKHWKEAHPEVTV